MSNKSAYASVQNVRDLTGLTSVEITDSQISGIIQHASVQLNGDVQIKWEDEKIGWISTEKPNDINSSNATYYSLHYPIGDRDNNGIVSGIDVYCYTIDSSGNRADIIVTGVISSDRGCFSLASAPSSDKYVYITYYSSPVNMEEPHRLVNLACTQLAAALCFTRIDVKKIQSFRVGKIAVMKQSQAFDIYKRQYYDTINRIRSKMFKVDHWSVTV